MNIIGALYSRTLVKINDMVQNGNLGVIRLNRYSVDLFLRKDNELITVCY